MHFDASYHNQARGDDMKILCSNLRHGSPYLLGKLVFSFDDIVLNMCKNSSDVKTKWTPQMFISTRKDIMSDRRKNNDRI